MAQSFQTRRGARRMGDVPQPILRQLAKGRIETVNLMEWLAADMAALARSVAASCESTRLASALRCSAKQIAGRGVTERLKIMGRALAEAVEPDSLAFEALAKHRSDLVRQWACYALNDDTRPATIGERLMRSLRFAADTNMSVREVAWMAFRPHLQLRLEEGLSLLEPVSRSPDQNVRRFAIEVTRPRSVWGTHIGQLKRAPQLALHLLENVKRDPARYVQLAVGNWLNDASKTRPDWVQATCSRWMAEPDENTTTIVHRGLRTLRRTPCSQTKLDFCPDLLVMQTS